jgi:hypothetical protein
MDPSLWLSIAALVVAVAALVLALLHRGILDRMLGDRPADRVVLATDRIRGDLAAALQPPRAPRPHVIAPPPMIGNYTLRDWLVHHYNRDGVWAEVVAEFYNRAAAVPWVLDYFGRVAGDDDASRARMAKLQRHFTAQLVIVTHTGVTAPMLDVLRDKHLGVTNSAGTPITGEVFDAVVDTLGGVLRDSGVPDRAIEQLVATCAPLRPVLVRA